MTCTLGLPGCNPAASWQQIRLGRRGCGPWPVEPDPGRIFTARRNGGTQRPGQRMAEETADAWCDAVAARGASASMGLSSGAPVDGVAWIGKQPKRRKAADIEK